MNGVIRIGIGGPVGSGKTRLVETLVPQLTRAGFSVAVITNDLVTDEDAQRVRRSGVIDPRRVLAVETGACPHTAIREDPSANLAAAERLSGRVRRSRPHPHRVRRRQPRRHVHVRSGRLLDLRHRHRGR